MILSHTMILLRRLSTSNCYWSQPWTGITLMWARTIRTTIRDHTVCMHIHHRTTDIQRLMHTQKTPCRRGHLHRPRRKRFCIHADTLSLTHTHSHTHTHENLQNDHQLCQPGFLAKWPTATARNWRRIWFAVRATTPRKPGRAAPSALFPAMLAPHFPRPCALGWCSRCDRCAGPWRGATLPRAQTHRS